MFNLFLEELGVIERLILIIATDLGGKKKAIRAENLFEEAVSQLSYSKEEIYIALNQLFEKKYLIEGLNLTKKNILNNKNRRRIYYYILEHPGTHVREIREELNLGAYETFRNLEYLEMFDFLRSKKFMNKKVYFLSDTNEEFDMEILLFKNLRTKLIYHQIKLHKKLRLSELERILNLDHGQIRPHIKKLLEFNFINSINENNIVYYIPIQIK